MNKIELIKKSIEDKKICNCDVSEDDEYYYFRYGYPNKWDRQIPKEFIDLLPISDPLEEQPDKGWIPVSKETMPDMVQALWIADKEGYMYEEMFKYFPNNVEGFSPYFYGYISKNILTLDEVGYYMFPQAPVKQG